MQDPLTPVKIVPHVGVPAFLDFVWHMIMMGWYTFLSTYISPIITERITETSSAETKFKLKRAVEAWKFGSGLDYDEH